MSKSGQFTRKLINWYHKHGIPYPWRVTKDPYKIIISEMLLRKTTRAQVASTFEKFFDKYGTFRDLARAPDSDIEAIIRPLGMWRSRAILLRKLSEIVLSEYDGKLPTDEKDLIKLPGIGLYSTNAVLCLLKNKNVPLLDTNMLRVMERVFSRRRITKRLEQESELAKFIISLIPKNKSRDFNLAILDFASMVCAKRNPRCHECPMTSLCDYYINNNNMNGKEIH